MVQEKAAFISNELIPLLKKLNPETAGKWGKMNPQQMVEHLSDFFKVSSAKIIFPIVTPEEHLPKYKEFLLSDKAFRENTRGPETILPEEPLAARHLAYSDAVNELEEEIHSFIKYFKDNPDIKTTHPVFGALDFNEWILLHHKHVVHHLKQFGLL